MGSARPFYREVGREREQFLAATRQKLPILLKGPTGCGKSRFVEAMAHELGLSLVTVACNEDTSASDLIGRYLIQGGETVWVDGPVSRALRSGALLYLDEIAEAREDVVVVLHSITDHRRELYVDRTNETLKAPAQFQLVVSLNPGYQRGLKEMKPSTRQRFVALAFSYPGVDIETEIVASESGLPAAEVKRMVELAHQIRRMEELPVRETVSTRLLVYAAKLVVAGLHPREACALALVGPLTDERETAEALNELVALRL